MRPKTVSQRGSASRTLRLHNKDTLAQIETDIYKTFTVTQKPWRSVRMLTSNLDKKFSTRIDQICLKLSIITNPRRWKKTYPQVQANTIARQVLKNKSQAKEKASNRSKMRRTIANTAKRHTSIEHQPFYPISKKSIERLQLKSSERSRIHPYIKVYEESQIQSMKKFTQQNNLDLGMEECHAAPIEAQQWQKQQKKLIWLNKSIRFLRRKHDRERQKKNKQTLTVLQH